MKERFEGDLSRPRLLNALLSQRALGHDEALVRRIADAATIKEHAVGDFLIRQDDGGNDVAFLLMGRVEILVNGNPVAQRSAGEHVGEMAAIDPKAKRSASVRSCELTVAAWVSEASLTDIAETHQSLWRGFARMLADRLRERGSLMRARNGKPRIFVGCTVEGLTIAQEVQRSLAYDAMTVQVWTDSVFAPSGYAVNDLLAAIERSDFAAFVVRGDDITKSRGVDSASPRDNVVFELGLFMGALGRDRTLIIRPRGGDLKIPSDLLGLRALDYPGLVPEDDLAVALGPVCTELRALVKRLGPR